MGGVGSQYAGSKPAGSIWPGSAPFLPDLEDLRQAEPRLCNLQGLMRGFFHPGEELFSVTSLPAEENYKYRVKSFLTRGWNLCQEPSQGKDPTTSLKVQKVGAISHYQCL